MEMKVLAKKLLKYGINNLIFIFLIRLIYDANNTDCGNRDTYTYMDHER